MCCVRMCVRACSTFSPPAGPGVHTAATHSKCAAILHTADACVFVCAQDVPVLLTRGEFDEVSGASALQVASALPSSGGQVATFKGAGSYMHIGESCLTAHTEGIGPPSTNSHATDRGCSTACFKQGRCWREKPAATASAPRAPDVSNGSRRVARVAFRVGDCTVPRAALLLLLLLLLLLPRRCGVADAWEPHLTRVEEHMCAAEGSKPPTADAN